MSARRELFAAAGLCLLGAVLGIFAAGKPWADVHAPGAIVSQMSIKGSQLTGAATALCLAGLAGIAALFAVRGLVRTGLGVLLTCFGGGLVSVSLTSTGRSHVLSTAVDHSQSIALASHPTVTTTGWVVVTLVAGVLLAAGGLLTAVRGARWPGMSSRYERGAKPRETAPSDSVGMWKALDRGEDPTGE